MRFAFSLFLFLCSAALAAAAGVTVGYECHDDSFRYQFHNPSRWDTDELVPHNYYQQYSGLQHWAVVRARYRFLNASWESFAGISAKQTADGDDFDTFFQPDGNVVLAGTSGTVKMRSFALSQMMELRKTATYSIAAGIRFRRDRSDFDPGNVLVRQTQPWAEYRWVTYDDEITKSNLYEIRMLLQRNWQLSGHWQFTGELDASPAMLASLTTILPQRYPGEEMVFHAPAFAVSPGARLAYLRGPLPVEFSVAYDWGHSYGSSSSYRRNEWVTGVSLRLK